MTNTLRKFAQTKHGQQKLSKIKCALFDFDGVFTDNRVHIDEHGREWATCSRFDGIGLTMLKKIGIKAHISAGCGERTKREP